MPLASGSRFQAIAGIAALLLLMLPFLVFSWVNFQAAPAKNDFGTAFYTAARMVMAGQGRELYDFDEQLAAQRAIVGETGSSPFYSPPVVALLYLPVALLPLSVGFVVWTGFSALLIAICLVWLQALLAPQISPLRDLPLILLILWVPVSFVFLNGQVDAIVLLVFTAALAAIASGRPFRAGLIFAGGLIKFQVVLPFVLIMLLRKELRFLAGFACGGVLFVALCSAVTTPTWILEYPKVLSFYNDLGEGIYPYVMANFRGLLSIFWGGQVPTPTLVAVSLAAVLWAARKWSSLESGFALAVTVSMLASYHLNPQSTILLVFPAVLLWSRGMGLSPLPMTVWAGIALLPLFGLWFASSVLLLLLSWVLAYRLEGTPQILGMAKTQEGSEAQLG